MNSRILHGRVPTAALGLAFSTGLTACQQSLPVGEWELVRRGDIDFPWDNSYADCMYVIEGAMSIAEDESATLTLDYDRSGDCYYGTGHTTLSYEGIAAQDGKTIEIQFQSTTDSSTYDFDCRSKGGGLECTDGNQTAWAFD